MLCCSRHFGFYQLYLVVAALFLCDIGSPETDPVTAASQCYIRHFGFYQLYVVTLALPLSLLGLCIVLNRGATWLERTTAHPRDGGRLLPSLSESRRQWWHDWAGGLGTRLALVTSLKGCAKLVLWLVLHIQIAGVADLFQCQNNVIIALMSIASASTPQRCMFSVHPEPRRASTHVVQVLEERVLAGHAAVPTLQHDRPGDVFLQRPRPWPVIAVCSRIPCP